MNQFPSHLSDDEALVRPSYVRLDLEQRDIVEHAISLLHTSNTMSAVEYLRSRDVDHGVIERVLMEPGRRRVVVD